MRVAPGQSCGDEFLMYEAEVNRTVESIETLPLEILKRFTELRDRIVARTTLPWGEHCTECVWPTCYTTCELYSPRKDGACRQFVNGMVRINHNEGASPYLLKIQFKQWGKLWTVGNVRLQSPSQARRREKFNILVGAIGWVAPLPSSVKPRVLTKINYLRRQSAENARPSSEIPDSFLLECYNPSEQDLAATFTVRPNAQQGAQPFQTMIRLTSGYSCSRVSVTQISSRVDLSQPFEVEIVPNDAENAVLFFGMMDFVKERQAAPATAAATKQFKCIVWDLDNTLWKGTLIEDGPEKLDFHAGVVDVIRQTDQRGILHSIASKNNFEDAIQVLRQHGLEEYFLYPQINWQPKSQSVAQVAKLLNIGVDAIAFVDDQAFEREEVKTVLPQVATIDAAECLQIPARPECNVPITNESRNRRVMYREQQQREAVLRAHPEDYLGFLKDCRMELRINRLNHSNLKRVYELAQRTNQLNFSGNRYQEFQLVDLMGSDYLNTYVIDCQDRFGTYGIVGFGVVDRREPRLLDLMFSCRIQSKRVEHAVLAFLLNRHLSETNRDFHANYRKTAKNAPSGKVFEEMGFEEAAEQDGVLSLVFRCGREIPDDRIVEIKNWVDEPCKAST